RYRACVGAVKGKDWSPDRRSQVAVKAVTKLVSLVSLVETRTAKSFRALSEDSLWVAAQSSTRAWMEISRSPAKRSCKNCFVTRPCADCQPAARDPSLACAALQSCVGDARSEDDAKI